MFLFLEQSEPNIVVGEYTPQCCADIGDASNRPALLVVGQPGVGAKQGVVWALGCVRKRQL